MYLKKTENGSYSFRWRIPLKDRKLFNGRNEIIKSLKTKNARIANKRAKQLKASLPILKERLLHMTDRGVDLIVKGWLDERLEADIKGRIEKVSLSKAKNLPYTKTVENTKENLKRLKKELAELNISNVLELGSTMIEEDVDLNNYSHKRLMFQLLRANVHLFKVLTERNKGKMNFNLPPKLTYEEAIEEYLPILYSKASARAKHKDAIPKQYVVAEKFLREKLLSAVGTNTKLPDRSSECVPILYQAFTRTQETARNKKDIGTVSREVQELLKAFFLWLFYNGMIPTNISNDIVFERVEEIKKEAFTPDMVNTILTNSTDKTNTLFRIYLYTGMRLTELSNCIYDEGRMGFVITNGKNKNALRFIPRHREIEDIGAAEIFSIKKEWSSDRVGRLLNKWIKENVSSDERYSLHSTRHCFNTWLVNAGVPKEIIKPLLGHEDDSNDMTAHYFTHFGSEEELFSAVNSVNYGLE